MNLPDSFMTGVSSVAAWAWDTSLVVLSPALVVLALGRWQGFPARWRGWLAAIVLIRLLLPWVPEVSWRPAWASPLQVAQMTAGGNEEKMTRDAVNLPQVPESAGDIELTAERADMATTPMAVSETFRMPSLAAMAVWFWLAGVVAVGGWILYSHVVLHRLIHCFRLRTDTELYRDLEWCAERMGVTRQCGLWAVRGLPTVAVHGWWRPVILVPEGLCQRFSTEEIRGMFLHELAHVRRGDLMWSRLLLVVCAVHWFNPLVWLLARRMRADAELECDRIALEKLSHTQRSHYGEALLKTLENSMASVPVPAVPFFRHTKEIQTRIQMIALPRSSVVARYAALLIVPALACLTLTTASRADDEKAKPAEEKAKGDGEQAKTGPRDGEQARTGPRDGEQAKGGPRDGEAKKEGPRDGEAKKSGPRDGEQKKTGARDGEGKKEGARDGEARKSGPRDGEGGRKEGARDGEGAAKRGARDGDEVGKGAGGETVTLHLTDKGENVTIRNKTMPIGRLRGYLNENGAGMILAVKADPDVPYRAVSEVLDAANDNGIKHVSLVSSEEEGGESKKSTRER